MFFKAIFLFLTFIIFNDNINSEQFIFNISGNKRVGKESIEKIIRNNLNKIENEREILEILFQTGDFSNINVKLDKNKIDIAVIENPIIKEIIIIGAGKISKKDIEKELFSKEHKPYSKEKIKYDVDRFYAFYNAMGYVDVEINTKIEFLENDFINIIFEINEGLVSKVKNINFLNNDNIYKFWLLDKMEIKPKLFYNPFSQGSAFEEVKFEEDKNNIRNLYFNKGYADFQIKSSNVIIDPYSKDLTIQMNFEEGEIYKINEIKFNDEKNILSNYFNDNKIKIYQNDIYSKENIEELKYNIEEYLSNNGLPFVKINYELKKYKETKKLDVIFNVIESEKFYIGKVEIFGNNKTKDYVIRRELVIDDGDLYDLSKIKISEDRLHMLGYFKNVKIKEIKREQSNIIDLTIEVEEQFFGNANFSFGYSTFEGLIGMVSLGVNNFMGHGKSINFSAQRSSFQETYSIGFYEPRLLNSRFGFGVDVFLSNFGNVSSIFGISSPFKNLLLYQSTTYGVNVKSGFMITERLYYNYGFLYSATSMSQKRALNFELYSQLLGQRQLFGIYHGITYNKTNHVRYPTAGYFLKYQETYAGIFGALGNQNFIKREPSFGFYLPFLSENLVFSFKINGGFVQNLSKNNYVGFENLYTLGYYNLRGFSFFGVGPKLVSYDASGNITSMLPYAIQGLNYFSGTFDLESPLFIPKEYNIRFSAFVDFGSLWGSPIGNATYQHSDGRVEKILDPFFVRVAAGFGIVWKSQMGEIRFDFAQPLRKLPYDIPMTFMIRFGTGGI